MTTTIGNNLYRFFLDVWNLLYKKRFDDFSRILSKHPDVINSLRDDGGLRFLMMRFGGGWTFFIEAAINQRKDIFEYLSKKPHDISICDDIGENVLHHIVWWNKDDVAVKLLNYLDDSQLNYNFVNKQEVKYKHTPLHRAALKNRRKSIDWLLRHGADRSLKNIHSLCPEQLCDDATRSLIRNFGKWQETLV